MQHSSAKVTRRTVIEGGSLFLLGAGTVLSTGRDLFGSSNEDQPKLRIGLVTDMHYADKPPAGSRHYRESLSKLAEAGEEFSTVQPDIVVELGDFIDAADSVATERSYLERIQKAFAELPGAKHYVLGNHCVYTLTKDEFLGGVGQRKSYYSFDVADHHFVVLDSCFRSDGTPYGRKNFQWTDPNIPPAEVEWLESDLKATSKKTIVFAHQRLDVENHYGVKNAPQIRGILEGSGSVLAVFQGHSHRNDHKLIEGIHYCTLVAMVEGSGAENNGYSTVDLFPNDVVRVNGYRQQADYRWPT